MLEQGAQLSQRDLSLPAHAAARVRLYEDLSLHGRALLAACQRHGAGIWLSALPTPGVGGTAIPGAAMRVATRVWLGVAARPDPPPPVCGCGADAPADGRHFLAFCPKSHSRRWRLHNRILHLVGRALEGTAVWTGVKLELQLDRSLRESKRPDLRATRGTTSVEVWGDVSVAYPFAVREGARGTRAPLDPVAAVGREKLKDGKYAPLLAASTPRGTFTPLVWETFGRIGPAKAEFLREAFDGPALAPARAGLLRDVFVAIWRSVVTGVREGYDNCFLLEGAPDGGEAGAREVDVGLARVGE